LRSQPLPASPCQGRKKNFPPDKGGLRGVGELRISFHELEMANLFQKMLGRAKLLLAFSLEEELSAILLKIYS